MKINIIKYIFLLAACFLLVAQSCSDGGSSSDGSSSVGQGGSMARFAIKGDMLYVVDKSTMKLFDIQDAAAPRYLPTKDQSMRADIETVFIKDALLFIGSETGMYIYNVSNPQFPQYLSFTSHIRSCDPVVAAGDYAYVTLNTESVSCNRGSNELLVYNISNPENPQLVKNIAMGSPKGLGVDGQKLFVCDKGVKVFDISNPASPLWVDDLANIPEADGIDGYDVIPSDGNLLLVGKNGIYQFDYTGENLRFLSKIEVSHE